MGAKALELWKKTLEALGTNLIPDIGERKYLVRAAKAELDAGRFSSTVYVPATTMLMGLGTVSWEGSLPSRTFKGNRGCQQWSKSYWLINQY